ncbi:MAG: DNA integrity scanning protein DisA nucleotide-binding domain protein [Candidatus Nanoarchaeia archaeon]|nr:DNA integrity scanning protein DisA nucleotide-binding domain protein [Candidatus Nanoarchaeia archaeon]MDD5357900.1 DNA integrity scanning protein DisA nucleotide-binding domain protein [Candidatus Nanoarchaeia archaeon]MDD5588819.1 DNA integrity scanning protein DisA nucleotide-binding domain protein [Candidatus Nanoarchaeia archaeon]
MPEKKVSLEEVLVQVGLRIAKRGEGALFVVGDVPYTSLVKQTVPPFNVIDNPKLLESLALIDGAVIIDKNGFLKAYGVMIKSKRVLKDHGTRHSAALTAATEGNFVVIISEEDRKVKILKDGKMVMQLDALQKNVEKTVPRIVGFLEAIGAGTVGAIGTSVLAPTLGIALLPGVIVFGSAYYLVKLLGKRFGER